MIDRFEKKHPNIRVKVTTIKVDDLRKLIKPALTSGKGPDIFAYDSGPGYLGLLAKSGLALDLTPYAKKYGWNERFPAWIRERNTFDGKLYGVGNRVELIGVYYNKAIFKKLGVGVPKNYSEFVNICKKAKAAGYIPISFDDKDQWPAFHIESVYYTAVAGKRKLDAVLKGKEGFDQPVFAKALDRFIELKKNGYLSKNPLAVSYDDGNKEFYSGKAAMRITGTWMVPEMTQNMKDNVGFFILPPVNANLPLMAPGGIGESIVVSAKTGHPQEATLFLNELFSKENAKVWYEQANVIPPIKTDVNTLNVSPLFKEVIQMANTPAGLSYNLDVLMPQKVNDVTMNALQELIAGKKTGADVVKAKQQALLEEKKAGNFVPNAP
jgi:raffinose/stachyose/melibiose transport system substrate-binding protein